MTFYPLEKLGMKPAVLELSIDVEKTEFYCIPTQSINLYLKGNPLYLEFPDNYSRFLY